MLPRSPAISIRDTLAAMYDLDLGLPRTLVSEREIRIRALDLLETVTKEFRLLGVR